MLNAISRVLGSAEVARLRLEMVLIQDRYSVEEITPRRFEAVVGYPPKDDDIERCNCEKAGQIGHYYCGWDTINNKPRFMTGIPYRDINHASPNNSGEPKKDFRGRIYREAQRVGQPVLPPSEHPC